MALFFIWVLGPAILVLLPADFFDEGPVMCLSRVLLDMECYGCGITRAVMHALHFEWAIAYEYNPLVVLVLPTLIFGWAKTAWDWKAQLWPRPKA